MGRDRQEDRYGGRVWRQQITGLSEKRKPERKKSITEMTDHELMEHCVGKRVMKAIDAFLAEQDKTTTYSKSPGHKI